MLSKYFKTKIHNTEFQKEVRDIISKLKNKRVLVYTDPKQFNELNKTFNLEKELNIAAIISDKGQIKNNNLKQISIKDIGKEDFDTILLTQEHPEIIHDEISRYLKGKFIKTFYIFNEHYIDERENFNFVLTKHIDKNIAKLAKKLKGKKVLFYGSGAFFKLLNDYFDLSKINAIGVADRSAEAYDKEKKIRGYKLYSPQDITTINPDYILVTAKNYYAIVKYLYVEYIKDSNIKLISITGD